MGFSYIDRGWKRGETRGGDISPAVEDTDSGSRKSIQAKSRPSNKKRSEHTNIKIKPATTTRQSRAAGFSERLRRRQKRNGQCSSRQICKQRNNGSVPTQVPRTMNAEDRAEMNKAAFLASTGEMLAKLAPSPKDLEHIVNRKGLHATKREKIAKKIREKASKIH